MWKMLLGLVVMVGLGYLGIKTMVPKPDKNTGLQGYTKGLQRAEDKARDVVRQDHAANVRNAVERYRVEKDAYPPSLQACVDEGYLEKVPPGVSYDPSTGQVSESN
jgi:hypothetical protein